MRSRGARHHDIDTLRAIAFALVMAYHVGMYYVAGWDWHLKSEHAAAWLQWPMRALNLWRMDLVFLLSGVALGLLCRKRSPSRLLGDRSLRLLLPLAFGMAVLVPVQPYLEMRGKGLIAPGFLDFLLRYVSGGPWPAGAFAGADVGVTWNHLWYLPYLWAYTVVWLALRPLLERTGLARVFVGLRGPRLLLWPIAPLLLWTATLWPHFPPSRDLLNDGWLHAVYFTLFLYGTWLADAPDAWAELRRLRWPAVATALALFATLAAVRALGGWPMAVRWLSDAYLWAAVAAILGWGHHALNRPWRWLPWANESVYPWYLLHQTLILLLAAALAPWRLGPVLEPALLLGGTALGCWAVTDALVRRSRWLRPLFGLKPLGAPPAAATSRTPAP